jgi:hypothetical protein
MADAVKIAQEAEARFAPLAVAANVGWWNSQVEATEENARAACAGGAGMVRRAG